MRARVYIDNLASKGRHHVPVQEVLSEVSGSSAAVRAQLRRLKERGQIAEPVRGFLLIIPSEYRQLGCLPPQEFVPQLMASLDQAYYFGLLTAAERHGAAHQRPQTTQVMVGKSRVPIQCGKVRVQFVARAGLERMPVLEANTPRGVARFSTPEVTALELVGYPQHAGGLNNVATVLSELAEEMRPDLLEQASRLSPTSWAQRLGYLLELVEEPELAAALTPFVAEAARSYTPLRRAAGTAGARVPSWKVIVNADVDPDL